MKLTTTTFVSVDGVMQGIGGPDEDRRGGFNRGGWTTPHLDKETATVVSLICARAEAFLLGRRTYEIFAASWGAMADPVDNPVAVSLNTLPKYVASTTLVEPSWANTIVLSREVPAALSELKNTPGRELQVHGSGTLVRWLLAQGLIDELTLLIFPVVVGEGARLFPDSGPDTALELLESRTTTSGVTIQTYRPNGSPQYGAAACDMKHLSRDALVQQ